MLIGIRKKVVFGFVIIALVLFTSGIISLFQLMQIEKVVSDMTANNIRSIEAAGRISDEAKTQTWKILDVMHDNSQGDEAKIVLNDTLYIKCLDFIAQNITIDEEKRMFDALYANYLSFKYQTQLLDSVFIADDMTVRNDWFNTMYRPVYESFAKSANDLGILNQNTMSKNSTAIRDNFYRLVIPLIVALAVGLFLVIMFNYFINSYFINPVLKIINGIKEYSENKQPYNVKIDTRDEIYELNREIKSLISHIKPKESAGVFNFNK
jgi:large-conductance mechanosensitive channel